MTDKSFPTDKKKQNLLLYLLVNSLFSDAPGIRLFRVVAMLLIIFGWGIGGAFIFRSQNSLYVVFLHDMPRYILAPLAAMIGVFLLGARYVQEIYQLPSYWSAVRYLYVAIFDGPPYAYVPPSGLLLPRLTISGGKKKIKEGEINLVDCIGGPGWLYIEPGNIAILERLQEPAAVLGAGMHYISRFQRIKEIISLKDQHWIAPPFRATTNDGIEMSVHDFQFGYKLYADHHSDGTNKRILSDPYPFSVQAARAYTYNRSFYVDGRCMSWGKSIQFRVDGVITDYINSSTLDQVTAPRQSEDDPREVMYREMIGPRIRNTLRNMLGTELLWVKIGRFEIEDKEIRDIIQQERLNAWFAQWAGKTAVILAQGKAEQIAQKESGRAETTANMLKSITQALQDAGLSPDRDENLWNIVLARTAQIIDSMTSIYGKSLGSSNPENESKKP